MHLDTLSKVPSQKSQVLCMVGTKRRKTAYLWFSFHKIFALFLALFVMLFLFMQSLKPQLVLKQCTGFKSETTFDLEYILL